MQEMFTKDLEELKNKQPEMNNTLEGINRITEVKELINDLEDRMVEITATEQSIEKRTKRKWRQPERPLRQQWTHQHVHHRGPRRRRKRSGEVIWRDNCWKLPKHGKGNNNQVQEAQSPRQDKPKEEHTNNIVIKSDEREEPKAKNTLPARLLPIWWRNQKLSREAKGKRIQHHQTNFTTNG